MRSEMTQIVRPEELTRSRGHAGLLLLLLVFLGWYLLVLEFFSGSRFHRHSFHKA